MHQGSAHSPQTSSKLSISNCGNVPKYEGSFYLLKNLDAAVALSHFWKDTPASSVGIGGDL